MTHPLPPSQTFKQTLKRYLAFTSNGVVWVTKKPSSFQPDKMDLGAAGGVCYILGESVEVAALEEEDLGEGTLSLVFNKEKTKIVISQVDNDEGSAGAASWDALVCLASRALKIKRAGLGRSHYGTFENHTSTEKIARTMSQPGPFPFTDRLIPELMTGFEAAIANKSCKALRSSSQSRWVLLLKKKNINGEDLAVWKCEATGTKAARFKIRTIVHASPDLLSDAANTFPMRLEWDKGMESGEVLRSFTEGDSAVQEGEIKVLTYKTAPAVGGSISSRDFFDIRWISPIKKDGSRMFVTYKLKDIGKNPRDKEVLGWAPPKNGVIRGENLEAVQYLDVKTPGIPGVEPAHTQFTMVSCSEIGGWLPTSVINSACSGSLVDMVEGITDFVEVEEKAKL